MIRPLTVCDQFALFRAVALARFVVFATGSLPCPRARRRSLECVFTWRDAIVGRRGNRRFTGAVVEGHSTDAYVYATTIPLDVTWNCGELGFVE